MKAVRKSGKTLLGVVTTDKVYIDGPCGSETVAEILPAHFKLVKIWSVII